MHLIPPDIGTIVFDGLVVGAAEGGLSHRDLHRQMQMVFQESYASLNPRLPVAMSIAFGPFVHGLAKPAALKRAMELLEAVGLDPLLFANRYPHELSGGQRQRINIARALALEPRIVILDEAVSALDKSVEAQVLNLLVDLKAQFDLTYVFISHDLNVVRYISDRVMVMYLGKVMEIGPVDHLYREPQHPYTQALLSAMPSMDPRRRTVKAPLTGEPPNPIRPPSGCRFRTRCPFAEAVCETASPALLAPPGEKLRAVACHMRVPGSGHSRAVREVSA
jgi:peptide/nickel transport system ATP-binding protein